MVKNSIVYFNNLLEIYIYIYLQLTHIFQTIKRNVIHILVYSLTSDHFTMTNHWNIHNTAHCTTKCCEKRLKCELKGGLVQQKLLKGLAARRR